VKILRHIEVPTGDILVVEGDRGQLELVSLGDYGKDVNLKCDALGLSNAPEQVRHTELLPLEKKWVITISTQYGCSMGCSFCDVPKVGPGANATFDDLMKQVLEGLYIHPEVGGSERLNIHFARMGEPTWNRNVLDAACALKNSLEPEFKVHPVVSTMMPGDNYYLADFLEKWMHIKNHMYQGNAGLQLSINSTDEVEREIMFGGSALRLDEIGAIMYELPRPVGRKITLNFAVADYTIDPRVLLRYFHPAHYIIKLTPMHKTATAITNGIETAGDYTTYYPYEEYERALTDAGYDVLVFIASKEEDEGLITCGNAILSGSMPLCSHKVLL
jgi:23S rRNA (adenine2503-C2)-methyltransferase